MSAFHLVHFPPTITHFSPKFSPSLSLSRCVFLSHTANHKKPNFQLFVLSGQAQDEAQSSIELENSEQSVPVEEEVVDVTNTRVLCQNVPWLCTADDLRPLFSKYGTVVDIEFPMYNKSRNRGLAFVTMSTHEEGLAVVKNLENTEFEGRELKLNWAMPKKPPTPPPPPKVMPVHNLFVANLPFQARAKDLKEFFGNAVSAEVIFQDTPRRSAGYGFVSFNTKAEAEAALDFDGKEFMGRPLRVSRSKRFLRQGTKATIESEKAAEVTAEA